MPQVNVRIAMELVTGTNLMKTEIGLELWANVIIKVDLIIYCL